jgi:phosphomethylpyrimidine synthase
MKITQDVRDYTAAQEGLATAAAGTSSGTATAADIEAGMAAKSAEFRAQGGEIYIPITPV